MPPHWAWFNSVVGRDYDLGDWDCFQLLLDAQAAVDLGRAFEPVYREGGTAKRTFVRNFARGLACFRRILQPVPACAVLFSEAGRPLHVGAWMSPWRMAHTNTYTATTLADFGPGSDYYSAFSGYYVPK